MTTSFIFYVNSHDAREASLLSRSTFAMFEQMKIAHTSDWHLGKTLFAHPLIEDQRTALGELISNLKKEQVDLLLISGDIYDRSIPPEDAVKLLDSFLQDVVLGLGIQICLIPGNHDSNIRLGTGAELLKKSGLHIFSNAEDINSPCLVETSGEKVAVFGIPYLEPNEWAHFFNGTKTQDEASPSLIIKSHQEALDQILDHLKTDIESLKQTGNQIIFMLHAFVAGGSASDSERPLAVGGSDAVSSESLQVFDYVALGHLHRPQTIGTEKIRYSGSLFPYSQSESDQERGFALLTISHGEITSKFLPFTQGRKLRTVRGLFEKIIETEKNKPIKNSDDYLIALLDDQSIPFEAFRTLRGISPGLLHIGLNRTWSEANIDSDSTGTLYKKIREEVTDQVALETFVKAAALTPLSDDDLVALNQLYSDFLSSRDEEAKNGTSS